MGENDIRNIVHNSPFSALPYDQWIQIMYNGQCPPGRYKHTAEVFQGKLYVVGGSRNGRYLSDIQVFDLSTSEWSTLNLKSDSHSSKQNDSSLDEVFPASASHSLVRWQNNLLVVAGQSKHSSDTVAVHMIDPERLCWSFIRTSGKIPAARGGQSVTLIGSKLIMFGGEDRKRHLLNDIHILDLETMTWDVVKAKKATPSPRFDHTAAAYGDQYLLIFGGSSHSACFNDLHMLDLQNMEWIQPEVLGAGVAPRGGHAATVLDENWYIVGGGDNTSGATETLVLNMSKLVWSVASNAKERHPLASEGLSLCSTVMEGENFILAFGGYNGKYNNELFIFKPKARDSTRPRLVKSAAAAAAAASVTAAYAVIATSDKENPDSSRVEPEGQQGIPTKPPCDAKEIAQQKKLLEADLAESRSENLILEGELEEKNRAHVELSMELQSVQGQLASEATRCFKLEVQIAEMQRRLDSSATLEQELRALHLQTSQMEKEIGEARDRSSGGVWQWVTGSN